MSGFVRRLRKQLFLVLSAVLILTWSAWAQPPVKNVIMMIGDGMGINHVTAARISLEDGAYSQLNMDTLPYTGFSITFSNNNLVTDSAAAATALATGFRTDNKRLGTLPNGAPAKSIMLRAKEQGLSTGVVATVTLTDATPAGYLVQADSRAFEKDIARAILAAEADVLLGGGLDIFGANPFTKEPRPNSLLSEAMQMGYTYVSSREELLAVEITPDLKLIGLFMGENMSFELTRFSTEPTLTEMTKRALELVGQNPKGFFLMVEGSRIDHAGHTNSIPELIGDVLAFDQAVGAALEYAQNHPDTLLIVTADHETGGLGITSGLPDGDRVNYGWLSTNHTAAMVPVYAYGPGAHRFTGTFHLTEIPIRTAELMGISNFPQIIEQKAAEAAQ
ncbi:MAG: alkaline phosphatase [Firmicutes bacterium]|nr:alkaline phosphatase [Bacillota bacterium]